MGFGQAKEILEILIIAGVLFLGVNLITARVRVESVSMEPNLHEGEFVVVNRMAYRWGIPERGDVIVFRFPGDSQQRYIKRIIGVEGDEITIEDGNVYINSQLVQEPYIAAPPVYSGEWTIGPQELFVLGDNRNNSNDSKNWGMLDVGSVIGKAVFIYWPPRDIGLIPHFDTLE
jgi:signal peptidase I